MSGIEERTVSLPHEHAAFLDAPVAIGAFASASEVVQAGLQALQERDAAVERWLRTEVVVAYDAHRADPSKAIPIDQVIRFPLNQFALICVGHQWKVVLAWMACFWSIR